MRLAALAVAIGFAVGGIAIAQPYPIATAPSRTTDREALHSLAIGREVHERFMRGLGALERAEWNAAVPEFTRIIALNPGEPKGSTARYDLGVALMHLADYDHARAQFEEALVRDPGFGAAAANLVSVTLLQGDLAAARSAADRFMRIAPDAARAVYSRGLVALRNGDLATARNDFRALIGNDPAYAIAHYDLALVEIKAERFDVAETELERALDLSPRYARARFALGTIFLRLGRKSDARVAFDRTARDATDTTLQDLAVNLRDRL